MKRLTCLALLPILAVVLGGARPASALTVRVDPAGGAPRLLVNGEPVRSRMFWGAPGSSPISLTNGWREVRFEFTARGSASNGTVHFRFGQIPGVVWLDDVRVQDVTGGGELIPNCDFESGPGSFQRDWTFWPTGDKNMVGTVEVVPGASRDGSSALRVSLRAPADGRWPDFHIYHLPRLKMQKGHRYLVSFWARAEPARELTLAFYQPGQTFTRLGGPADCFEPQIKLAAEVGVDFVSFPIPLPWPKPGAAVDWTGVDEACDRT